ncbi:hypothetical protein J2X65_004188 [Ancylobacter sp. 3268]|uniref:hypothetical protein n=1 Tax=Ancylobacter sp. 3268 TaxID=2817752 RepID=UPI002865C9D2|nr:hypothetical protein [Ancylobacter sp. 3268]MDR6954812.1 hypothetical protein [Ancylobacter sp. 3268]
MGNGLSSFSRTVGSAGIALTLAACPGEQPSEPRERVAASPVSVVAGKQWLQPSDATEPDIWLASRAAGHDLAAGDPAAAHWRAVLADADERFGENARMIANRAVQLETMLREIDIEETVPDILADFAPFAEKGSRSGFSDLCQHYYNLRSQGLTREAALAVLRQQAPPSRAPAEAGATDIRP